MTAVAPEDRATRYFRLSEWRCKDGTGYPEVWIESRWRPLAEMCDVIREHWGEPLIVHSGYRTEAWNRHVKGEDKSLHLEGRAADLRPLKPARAPELHAIILRLYKSGKLPNLGGLGDYTTFVHVDIRRRGKDDRLKRWAGERVAG